MAYVKPEDTGKIVHPLVANESEDGTGTWHVIVTDTNGYVQIVVAA